MPASDALVALSWARHPNGLKGAIPETALAEAVVFDSGRLFAFLMMCTTIACELAGYVPIRVEHADSWHYRFRQSLLPPSLTQQVLWRER